MREGLVPPDDLLAHGQPLSVADAKKDLHHVRIKLSPGAALELPARLVERSSRAVGPSGDDYIERIGDGKDSRF